jgi:tRNA-dihydrouridine synthase A
MLSGPPALPLKEASSLSPHFWRFSVAPMMDWTDRHCRFFHRQLSHRALLYTEMVTTGALIHGNQPRHLDYSAAEHPLALQLGGSEPSDLARCAKLAEQWGYDELNLNCGCPSERVQRGAFGACLMAEPRLVAECVDAMREACDLPVTVKHRVGLDKVEDYGFVRDFVGTVAQAGTGRFIVHARNAWLKGLSPKENRTVPPLRYDMVRQLKIDFPHLQFVLNGGLRQHDDVAVLESGLPFDGLMVGRAAYEDPWMLSEVDRLYYQETRQITRDHVLENMKRYCSEEIAKGVALRNITRHMLGLFNGLPGARHWRRLLSDATRLGENRVELLDDARGLVVDAPEA